MTTKRSSLFAGSAAVVLGLVLSACSNRTERTVADATPQIPVAVARVATAEIADTFEAGGVVQARMTATTMARILAPVREVHVAPGDRVRAGQVLVVLDGRDLAAQARSARAAVQAAGQSATAAVAERQAADAALMLARTTHERIAGLNAKRSATAQELDNATGALRAAEAHAAGAAARAQAALSGVESVRADSEAAGVTESFTFVTAPFDGVVTDKMVEPGNMAAPGTPLIRVEDTGGFRLDVRVDESRIGQVTLGAVVPVGLDSGTDGATTTINGTVAEIGRAVDADARAFLVKIALPQAAGFRSGTFGRAQFSSRVRRALTVPEGAIVRRGQMASVFVVQEGIAHVRLLDVRGTEVLAGLSEGEVVVIAAPPTLTDGGRVVEGGR